MPKENPDNEQVKECSSGATKKELLAIKKEIDGAFAKIGSEIRLGNAYVALPPYSSLPKDSDEKPILTTQQYFEYVSSLVTSAKDVSALMNPPYLKWEDDDAINQRLFPAHVTLARGGGDCDNMSQVAKEFLDALGCKDGHDYKAKVISCPDVRHAITIYTGRDGKLACIEQWSQVEDIADIYSASTFFEKLRGTNSDFYEAEPLGLQGRVSYSIEANTLERNHKLMEVTFTHSYHAPFDPEKDLPPAWRTHEKVSIFFSDGTKIVCFNGKMDQLQSKDETLFYNDNGKVKERSTSDKEEFYDDQGRVNEVHYLDVGNPIEAEFFYPETGVVRQRDFKEGQPKKNEIYDESGHLKQISYFDGTFESYDETGTLLSTQKSAD